MIALSLVAVICIFIFQGNTEQLIPLYAVGVFVPFTCALFALVVCYWKTKQMILPLLAMILTLTVVIVLVITKWQFVWPVIIFVPLIMYGCIHIRRHYDEVERTLKMESDLPVYRGQMMIIPISGIHQTTKKALAILDLQHCTDVYALYIGKSNEEVKEIKEKWAQVAPNIRLIAFVSTDQHLLRPLVRAILKLKGIADKKHFHVIVTVPQLVTQKKWHAMLHNHHAFSLKQALLEFPTISVMTVPFQVGEEQEEMPLQK